MNEAELYQTPEEFNKVDSSSVIETSHPSLILVSQAKASKPWF